MTDVLTVYVLDEEESLIKLPSIPWDEKVLDEHGELWMSDSPRFKLLHYPDKKILIALDLDKKHAIYWVKSSHQVPYYESSAPLRPILHWWLNSKESQLVHAAAVGFENGGVLLVGKGGSGKTNTAVSCLNSNLAYLSDDYCAFSLDNEPRAISLFATSKLYFKDLNRHPFLKGKAVNEENTLDPEEKALFYLYPEFKDKLVLNFPIKAIFIPKVFGNEKAKIYPISKAKAYLAIAPTTIFQLKGENHKSHRLMVELLNKVPTFLMELSTIPENNTREIEQFLTNMNYLNHA